MARITIEGAQCGFCKAGTFQHTGGMLAAVVAVKSGECRNLFRHTFACSKCGRGYEVNYTQPADDPRRYPDAPDTYDVTPIAARI